jgi:hypothetical protein
MFLTKILERKSVIRFFGFTLILSPAFMLLQKVVWVLITTNKSWHDISMWTMIVTIPLSYKILYFANFVIGILVLAAAKNAWMYTLFLLLGYLAVQFANLTNDYKQNKMSLIYPMVNIIVSMFIADQLVYKVKPKKARSSDMPIHKSVGVNVLSVVPNSSSVPTVPKHKIISRSRKKVLLYLEGVGSWAQLTNVSKEGLKFRILLNPPQNIFGRKIKLSLKNGLTIHIQLLKQMENELLFNYSSLNSSETKLFNDWLTNICS